MPRSCGCPAILREPYRPEGFPMPDDSLSAWPPQFTPAQVPGRRTELWTMLRGEELRRAELVEREGGAAELQFFAFDQFPSGQRLLLRELATREADVRSVLEVAGWTCVKCHGELW